MYFLLNCKYFNFLNQIQPEDWEWLTWNIIYRHNQTYFHASTTIFWRYPICSMRQPPNYEHKSSREKKLLQLNLYLWQLVHFWRSSQQRWLRRNLNKILNLNLMMFVVCLIYVELRPPSFCSNDKIWPMINHTLKSDIVQVQHQQLSSYSCHIVQ